MGERRRKLIQEYEDAKLALLLDEYAEVYGKVSIEQYKKDLADGKIKEISDQEADAQLNAILQRAEEIEAKPFRIRAKFKTAARKMVTVAASIAILFILLLTVQAAGVDVFGTISRWTNSVFIYNRSAPPTEAEAVTQTETPLERVKDTIIAQGFPQAYAPSWLPERFVLSELKSDSNENYRIIQALFSSRYKEYIIIEISSAKIDDTVWNEKDYRTINALKIGKIGDTAFRVFQNNSSWSAIWCDGKESIAINCDIELEELKKIITSMGE